VVALIVTTLASLALLAIAFVPLERAFPARPGQPIFRPAVAVDLCFFLGQYLVWSTAALSLLLWIQSVIGDWAPRGLREQVAAWPLWAQAALAVALGDLLVYWFHRACHTFEPLWWFHAVHHSSEHLDFLAAHREHPVDGVLTQFCVNLPAFVLGVPLELIGAFLAFRGMWALFIHSNVSLPLGPLRWLFGAPELHHFHHARVARTRHNFSNLAPWVDALFGTYRNPGGLESYPLGLPEAWPKGYLAQLLHPFARLFRRLAGARSGG
jgi:sterol desaturase/sphingolipid hydroxylase (fatty acid hydroxylase superfamily)